MMLNRRFRNSVISAKIYTGMNIVSDHTPLVGKRLRKTNTSFNVTALKDPSIKQKLGLKIIEQIN